MASIGFGAALAALTFVDNVRQAWWVIPLRGRANHRWRNEQVSAAGGENRCQHLLAAARLSGHRTGWKTVSLPTADAWQCHGAASRHREFDLRLMKANCGTTNFCL